MMIGPSGLRAIAAAAVALVVSTPLVAADRYVHRRSGLSPWRVARVVATPDELVVSIDDRGLIREDRITWDRVAAVDPDSAGRLEVGVSTGLALGDRIWRGIRRLQRGDARLAREAFEEARNLGPRLPGDLASATLEGLVRSGIALGDTSRVLAEALVLGELTSAGQGSDRFDGPLFASAVVDAATGLVPEVPPVGGDVDVIELRRGLRNTPILSETSEIRRDLWVRLIERAGPPEVSERGLDEGTRLLLDLARLDAEDPQVRTAARRRLLDRIDDQPAWRIAWIRWFTGSAAIQHAEGDADGTLVGILDLVNVLALEQAAPLAIRLAALQLAADALARIDRDDDAAVLRAILAFEHPDRPGTESTP
jgi:hypothetical protein